MSDSMDNPGPTSVTACDKAPECSSQGSIERVQEHALEPGEVGGGTRVQGACVTMRMRKYSTVSYYLLCSPPCQGPLVSTSKTQLL